MFTKGMKKKEVNEFIWLPWASVCQYYHNNSIDVNMSNRVPNSISTLLTILYLLKV